MKLRFASAGVLILIGLCRAQQPQNDLITPAPATPVVQPGAGTVAEPAKGVVAKPQTNVVKPPSGEPSVVDRFLFPRNFARGYVDFQMAPPHNEMDLGLCRVNPGDDEYRADCRAYVRYAFSGYLELQPFGRGQLRRLFMITEPKFYAGDNLPQQHYTYSAAPILMELSLGAGIAITDRAEFRLVTHKSHLMGRYADSHGPVSQAPDGPYGSYTTVGVRYYFGNYGRSSVTTR